MDLHQARMLLVIYGTGFAAVSIVFALLHLHAWKHRELLGLTEIERLRTRHALADNLGMVLVGLTSTVLSVSLPEQWVSMSVYFYFSIGAYYTVAGFIFGRRERRLKQTLRAEQVAAATAE